MFHDWASDFQPLESDVSYERFRSLEGCDVYTKKSLSFDVV